MVAINTLQDLKKRTAELLITTYKLSEVDEELYQQLYVENLDNDEGMRGSLDRLRSTEGAERTYCIVIKDEYNKVIGWTMILSEHPYYSFDTEEARLIFIWVTEDHRQKGYAYLMVAYALNRFKQNTLWFTPWDEASIAFGEKLCNIHERFKIVERGH